MSTHTGCCTSVTPSSRCITDGHSSDGSGEGAADGDDAVEDEDEHPRLPWSAVEWWWWLAGRCA